MSSKYTGTNLSKYGLKILFIKIWKQPGSPVNLEQVRKNSNFPYLVVKAVIPIISSHPESNIVLHNKVDGFPSWAAFPLKINRDARFPFLL